MVDEPMEKQWENDCNKTILLTRDRPKTSVWSPGFPRQYPDNLNCFTFITVPTGFRIVLEFEELVIENEPQ
jgi:CUB domain